MVGYMNVEEQVDEDFTRARRKALLGRIGTRLRRDAASDQPPCFEEVRKIPGIGRRVSRGKRTVPLGQIAGSVGRCSDFDRDFLPAKENLEERWKRIDRAFHLGEQLPPVSLYKICGAYFVLDGHHRVSVARYHGVKWIDADVTEFGAPFVTPSLSEPTRSRSLEETKEHPRPNGPPERGDPKVREMMDFETWKQRREEMMREAEQDRLAKVLRDSRKRHGAGRASSLAWELKRIAGRLRKLSRTLRKAD